MQPVVKKLAALEVTHSLIQDEGKAFLGSQANRYYREWGFGLPTKSRAWHIIDCMMDFKDSRRDGFICLLLIVVTVAAYWPVRQAEFVAYDDNMYVFENVHIQSGLTWKGLAWALTTGYAANWHPLTWITHMLDCQMYGLDAGKHHLTNLLLHVLNSMLLYGWLRSLTGAVWRSAFVAALFAWHPVHVESVAWVAERKDVLSTFFWILTLWAYVAYVRRPDWRRFALVHVLFALGLMAKPMLVTLPCLLLLLDFWPLKRTVWGEAKGVKIRGASWHQLILEKMPLFLMSGTSCLTTYFVQEAGGAMGLPHLSAGTHWANALISYARYLGKIFWPSQLAAIYPYDESLPAGQVLAAGLLLLTITVTGILLARRCPYLIVGWLWFLGTLVPVIGLIQVGEQSMADRYTYIPAVGIFIGIAWGLYEWQAGGAQRKWVLGSAASLALAGCVMRTHIQVNYWHDTASLFRHALAVTTDNAVAAFDLGQVLAARGEIKEAMGCYAETLRIHPKDSRAQNNLGLCLARQGKPADATNHFMLALQLNPTDGDAANTHLNYGLALTALGDSEGANDHYLKSLMLKSDNAEAHFAEGLFLLEKGQPGEAAVHFSDTVRLKPNHAAARVKLGSALFQSGKSGEAAGQFEEALRFDPDSIEALNNLAWIRAASSQSGLRDGQESIRLAQHACELTGNTQPLLLGTLAAAYAEAGQFSEAEATARKAEGVALAAGQNEVAARNHHLLELYQTNRAYHETPNVESPKL